MQATFTIGELADAFGVSHRTLRFYEDKGLIHPQRQGVTRLYSRRDRRRLELILLGRKVGFSLDEIGSMLAAYDLRDGHPAQLKIALSHLDAQAGMLERRKQDIEEALEALARTRALVAGMLAARSAKVPGGEEDAALQAAE